MIHWGDWLLCIPPATLLTAVAWWARRQTGTWSAPGPMSALAWCALTWFALLLAPDYHIWPGTLWIILALVLAVHFGGLVGESLLAGTPSVPAQTIDLLTVGRWTSIVGSAAGIFAVLYTLRSLGESLTALTSPMELIMLAGRMSLRRYEQGYVEPFVARVLMAATYCAAFMGGVCAGLIRVGRPPRWVWYPMAPAVLLATVTTARAILLYVAALWVGGWIAAAIFSGRSFATIVTWRTFRTTTIALVFFIALSAGLQQARYGPGSPWTALTLLGHMRVWFFGYVSALSYWLQNGAAAEFGTSYGSYTFAGVFNLLGISARSLGIYRDFAQLSGGEISNVYTMFRGLLQDFGIVGGALTAFGTGMMAGIAHACARRGYLVGVPFLAMFYAVVLFSYITSLLNYNSIILGWLLFVLIVAASRLFRRPNLPALP